MNNFSAIKNAKRTSSPLLKWIFKTAFLIIFAILTLSFLLDGSDRFTLTISHYIRNFRSNSEDAPAYNFTDFSDSLTKTGRNFWLSMKPSFKCPASLLTKVGKLGDGGKWTCGVKNLAKLISEDNQPPCVVYSFGVSKDSSFEAEVLASTHCDVYAYDPTVDSIANPLKSFNPRVHFEKLGISGKNSGKYRTLKTLMESNSHEWVDILKIDVEGAEYQSLEKIMDDFNDENGEGLPFGQLLVEVHVFKWSKMSGMAAEKAKIVVEFFQRLEKCGLRMFNFELNTYAGGLCCSEFSFININSFSLERFLENSEWR